jgi:hypothetical protein
MLIGEFYKQKVNDEPSVDVLLSTTVKEPVSQGGAWRLLLENGETGSLTNMEAAAVINATYCSSNSVNRLFGLADIHLMHEISEIAFLTSPQLKDIGLTVMDGQFGSLMPYGKSDLLSLSSVAYTHHKVSYDNLPSFDCQQENRACTPRFTSNCNFCPAKPRSNSKKMVRQISQYFSEQVELNYLTSMYTIKSKLKANFIDDGRPTEISKLHESPDFYCIFAGKINSIYEIEKVV